jgi:hypothetical protein
MSKTLSLTLLLVGVLFAALIAQAKGPSTKIIVHSDIGVTSASSVDVTLCGDATTASCTGGVFVCDNTGVDTPGKTTSTCGPAGFKVGAYEYAISVNSLSGSDCTGFALAGDVVTCAANLGTITLQVGH